MLGLICGYHQPHAAPTLYKHRENEKDLKGLLYFQCPICYRQTPYFATLKEAVAAWRNDNVHVTLKTPHRYGGLPEEIRRAIGR